MKGAGQKGLHEYGEYLKRKCYREKERERERRGVLLSRRGEGGGAGRGMSSGTSIPRLQSGRANPRGRVHRPMR